MAKIVKRAQTCPGESQHMPPTERNRSKQETTLTERLAAEAKSLRERAEALPPGLERDELLKKARQDETAAHMTDWLTSPGLQPPS